MWKWRLKEWGKEVSQAPNRTFWCFAFCPCLVYTCCQWKSCHCSRRACFQLCLCWWTRLEQVSLALSCPSTVSLMRQGGTHQEFEGQRFLSLLFDAWLAIPLENKKVYKQKALLRWLYHTLMLVVSACATDLQEALMALKTKLIGAKVEGTIHNMFHCLWKQMISRQTHCWQD